MKAFEIILIACGGLAVIAWAFYNLGYFTPVITQQIDCKYNDDGSSRLTVVTFIMHKGKAVWVQVDLDANQGVIDSRMADAIRIKSIIKNKVK